MDKWLRFRRFGRVRRQAIAATRDAARRALAETVCRFNGCLFD
jgi:hypothetical protein